jgi:hypothetical protein
LRLWVKQLGSGSVRKIFVETCDEMFPHPNSYLYSATPFFISHIPHFKLKHKKITSKEKAKNQDDEEIER